MIYSDFQGEKLSKLGFGAMRLPLIPGGKETDIDMDMLQKMVDYAIANGVNYFDTAYPYHGGCSELALAKALAKYPREKYYIADKFPGHQISESYNPSEVFEDQLKKCGVEYFDFYLMHNVNERSMSTYMDERWGILDYFVEQKKLGRIRHLGISTHGAPDNIEQFLDAWGENVEFCQIQLNYLDWSLQKAKEKVELLNSRHIPVWVMESVRGGKLASFDEKTEAKLKAVNPDKSIASWGFRWLQGVEGVTMILSGMSNIEQVIDNVASFEKENKLSDEEEKLVFEVAETLKNSIPCTGCRYCCKGCPAQLDIPRLISYCNELRVSPDMNSAMRYGGLPEDKKASACVGCGACMQICPQGINVPEVMKELTERYASAPNWDEICRKREEAQKRLKQSAK